MKASPTQAFFFPHPPLEIPQNPPNYRAVSVSALIFPMSDPQHTPPSAAATGQTEPAAMDEHFQPETPPADPLMDALAELAQVKATNADLADQFLRAKAEAENARRRAEEEISKARKFSVEAFAESLLPVADSLTAGLALADANAQQLREGSEATLRQLKSALERHKVIEINPEAGAKFDPHQHQAISVVPAEQEPNTVVTVLQMGYLIADRVLRPALVTVTAPK